MSELAAEGCCVFIFCFFFVYGFRSDAMSKLVFSHKLNNSPSDNKYILNTKRAKANTNRVSQYNNPLTKPFFGKEMKHDKRKDGQSVFSKLPSQSIKIFMS